MHEARDAARNAADHTRRLYREGRLGYLDSTDAERTLATAQAALAASQAQLSLDQVDLFLALGGGWRTSQPPAASRRTTVDGHAACDARLRPGRRHR